MQNDIITPTPIEEYDELGLTPEEVAELYEISARRKTHPETFTPWHIVRDRLRKSQQEYKNKS